VSPGVVELLEVIDVEQHEAEEVAGLDGLGPNSLDGLVESAPVCEPGEGVSGRLLADLLQLFPEHGDF
jgi:hypothetical protein